MPTFKTTVEPVHDALTGRLLGYNTHADTLTPVRLSKGKPTTPPPPQQALRTATPTTRPRPKPTPARQPQTPAPVPFLSPSLKRVVTLTHCCACNQRHAHCQCLPSCSARQLAVEAAAAAAPYTRLSTFQAVVERQRANGMLPGTSQPAGVKTGAGVPRLNTFEECVRLQKLRGLR